MHGDWRKDENKCDLLYILSPLPLIKERAIVRE